MENPSTYSSITAAECENFLDIIQKDFELRPKDHEHLRQIQEEVIELTAQRKILAKRKEFNEKCCILCYSSFNLLFRRKIKCHDCGFWVCRSCTTWENQHKIWICRVCEKQRCLDAESWTWFYNRLRFKFSRFGDAKVLENICQKRKTSDSENDSGYGPSCDFKPLLNLFSVNSKRITSMADSATRDDCEDEDEEEVGEEEEEAEIHNSIETIVDQLLGSTLDDASVDRVYMNSQYERIFSTFHGQLVDAIRNLSNSLRRALHNMPHENNMSPTESHVALKRLIVAVVKECAVLPYLQTSLENEMQYDVNSISLVDVDIFSSYEGLVASAIINKVVEDNQAKYVVKHDDDDDALRNFNSNNNVETIPFNVKASCIEESKNDCMEEDDNAVNGFTEELLPLECIQVEEVEEITQEYTDSEDDKYSSVSHQSSGLQSIDDLSIQRGSSEMDLFYAVESQNEGKVPFPEFGPDLVEDLDKVEDSVVCHPVAVTSWEENWLFRKKRRLPLYSNLKYQLLTYCDEPPCMLIPFPSETNDALEPEESSSELSESHSVGSLDFSSDSETHMSVENQQYILPVLKSKITHQGPTRTCGVFTAPFQMSVKTENASGKKGVLDVFKPNRCEGADVTDMQGYENAEVYCGNSNFTPDVILDMQNLVSVEGEKECNCEYLKPHCTRSNIETTSHRDELICAKFGTLKKTDSQAFDDIFQIPTQPGSIAEREHKKWLNAVPLKNNPYSAENISRRNSTPHKPVILSSVASFEEFEEKLKKLPHLTIKEPFQTKLNCGLKSIDSNLYKRDYYVNHFHLNYHEDDCYHYMSLPNFDSVNNENCEGIPEEALNSLEEKVYVSAGKVFTLENHVKRLERELKDLCLSSSEGQSLPSTLNLITETVLKDEKTHDYQCSSDPDENLNLPSVKILATKFSPSSTKVQNNLRQEKVQQRKLEDIEKIKKTRPCMKVHSLTARSLSREFRDRARQNIPKPMNRLLSVSSQANEDIAYEHENLCSPVSAPSPVTIPQNELTHGYTSDESSTSTSSLPRLKTRRHISRSILQRASYWERRAEQGLLSDTSVTEEFPGLPVNPD